MEFFHKIPKIPFMAQRRLCYVFSAILILGSVAAIGVRGLNLAVDFTGGVVTEAEFPGAADLEKTRAALTAAGYTDAQVQSFGSSHNVLVRLPPDKTSTANDISGRIEKTLATVDPAVKIQRTEVVGATVGKELLAKGIQAMALTLLLILGYIALQFRWKFGVGAVLATLHDPFVTIGVFALFRLPFDL